jgi:hypothetical protein
VGDPTTTKAPTNAKPGSCVGVQCDCNTMWSFTQQYCYLRLCTNVGNMKAQLVKDYAVRARRISATYARFYLEQEEGGDAAKKGRFYWMALGAFASKTVACTLEDWRVQSQAAVLSEKTKEGLGKGNFWLFCDIAGWHHYYIKYDDTFDMCLDSRNTNTLVPSIKAQTKIMPWSGEALPKVKQLAVSKEIKAGFALVKKYESTTKRELLPDIQFNHLLAIADHEQGVILQPLIYDDADFVYWIKVQRSTWVSWAAPGLELVFSSACSTHKAELKSVAPKETKLENLESRMTWIRDAAMKFHGLMQSDKAYMEGQIGAMAGWAEMPDKK